MLGKDDERIKLFKSEIAKYNQQIKDKPRDGSSFRYRTLFNEALGNDAAANDDYEAAKMLERPFPNLGDFKRYAFKKGKYDLAFSLERERIGKHRPDTYSGFARVYVQRKS